MEYGQLHKPPTTKQQELIDRLLNPEVDLQGKFYKTFRLQDLDQLWYNNSDYTLNALAVLFKKGLCSPVKFYTRHSTNSFEIRYHFPDKPFSSNINAIRNCTPLYDYLDKVRTTYESMIKSSTKKITPKQGVMLKILEHNFGTSQFTRQQLNGLYWQTIKTQNAPAELTIKTFAHQLIHLVAKGKLRVIKGNHIRGTYELADISDQRELRKIIYDLTLAESANYMSKESQIPAFPWEFEGYRTPFRIKS